MKKRILIILAVVVVVLGILIGVYYFFFASRAPKLQVGTSGFGGATSGAAAVQNPIATGQSVSNAGTQVAPSLVKVTSGPVADGFVSFDTQPVTQSQSSTSSSTVASAPPDVKIRYIDRQSGNVYEYGGISRTLTRLSDKTLPGAQEASWLRDGSVAFVRFLATADGSQQLDTYALPFNGNGGYSLQQNLDEAMVTPSNVLFTLESGTDTSVGTVANADGTNAKTLFSSPLTALRVYSAGSRYIAVTKAAAELDGYAFTIGSNGSFTPILGPLEGLTILPSHSGNLILYSYVTSDAVHMGVLNLADGSEIPLPVSTIAEKCVWLGDDSGLYCAIPTSFGGTLPDDWYQGVVSFNDRVWKIDLESRLATLIIDPTSIVKSGIDAVGLTLDPNEQILTFMNKTDGSLWAYSL